MSETVLMPEGCYWEKKADLFSVYMTYPVLSSQHEYLGSMTDLLGQTYDEGEATEIAESGRKKKIAELKH